MAQLSFGGLQRSMLLAILILVAAISSPTALAGHIQDINPNSSDLDASDPDGGSGGRVNGLAAVAGDNQTFYAATEWGGLYRTTNAGVSWAFLNGHRPMVTWDVEVDPSNTQRVYATSFFDGREAPRSGIEVSTDGGNTWTHPASAIPPAPSPGFTCADARRDEPSAFGIGIRPDAANNVFIGTNCGVAISTDSGATWNFVDPTPATAANDVWDVVVQAGGPTGQGVVDICGDDGHRRSTNGGATWTGGGGIPGGICSIAVSPDESYVLIVRASNNRMWESDDAGATWTNLGTPDPRPQGRISFLTANQRSNGGTNNVFDIWYGDVRLYRVSCTTPATPAQGGANRCPAGYANPPGTGGAPPAPWAGPFTRSVGAHDDAGDLVFDTEDGTDPCPMVFSSDGGVYRNTDLGGDCQNPNWEQPSVSPHATWLFTMDGANRAGDAGEDLYFGLQDAGSWATTNAGAGSPSWSNKDCCDVFDFVADGNRVVQTFCCAQTGRRNIMFLRNPGDTGGGQINTYPADGLLPGFAFTDIVDTFGDRQYVVLTRDCPPWLNGLDDDGDGMVDEADENNGCSGANGGDGGVYVTNDITLSPIVWTELGNASEPNSATICGVRAAVSGATPTFYVQVGGCNGNSADQLWTFTGTNPAGAWTRIDTNLPGGGVGVFAVDPNDPNRLYVSNLRAGVPFMMSSDDGGTTWDPDPELDDLMDGNGIFEARTTRGPTNFTGFGGYPQPSLVAFDPEDSDIIVAGGVDSGVFLSTDAGANWTLLTDPFTSDTSGEPHLPRPRYAYFDHEPAADLKIYVGTQGRGVWRIALQLPTADANGPYATCEGTDVVLDGSGSSDPDGGPLTYEWDFDGDGDFDDATGVNPPFDRVGQDGSFTIALKVTDPDGGFDVDEAIVNVCNVAPNVVGLVSDAPVDEGSMVTLMGTITDPGWLEVLTGTIDWGDGTAVEPLSGVLENVRPDATLTFSGAHVYGDNGTFIATVCGFDDDTSTCDDLAIEVDNVDPTAEIDESATVLINGVPTFVAHAGEPVDFEGRSTDPGSDDLFLSWDWGDGLPTPDVTTTYLVNPPNPDPFPSPTIQPRDLTDRKTHAFSDACLYVISFRALDDDGGAGLDTANVIISGNAEKSRSQGYWQHQYRRTGSRDFTDDELECLLAIVGYVSTVFNEERDASTIERAHDVLFLRQNRGSAAEKFDRQLLATLLNFANGSLEWVDIDNVIATAEAVRLDPISTDAELREQRRILAHLR
jgi:hypothetical protein